MVDRGEEIMGKTRCKLLIESLQLLQVLELLDLVDLLKGHNRVIHSIKWNISGGYNNVNIGANNVVSIQIVLVKIVLLIYIESIDDINNDLFQWFGCFVQCDLFPV